MEEGQRSSTWHHNIGGEGPLQEDKDWGTSLFFPPTRLATPDEKKKILSLCVEQGLIAALNSHLYLWNREVREQGHGLPIGLDLTRAVARLVLMDWDQQFLRLSHRLYKWPICLLRLIFFV